MADILTRLALACAAALFVAWAVLANLRRIAAARHGKWWLRGAYEDVFRLDLDGLLFPLGTNLCSSLWVYTWGMVGARLGDRPGRAGWVGLRQEFYVKPLDVSLELLRVKPDGSFTFDESYGWADGWITWDVPFGWNSPEAVAANSEANSFREFDPQAGHRFAITTNGTVTVRKFGNEAVREANEDTSQGGVP